MTPFGVWGFFCFGGGFLAMNNTLGLNLRGKEPWLDLFIISLANIYSAPLVYKSLCWVLWMQEPQSPPLWAYQRAQNRPFNKALKGGAYEHIPQGHKGELRGRRIDFSWSAQASDHEENFNQTLKVDRIFRARDGGTWVQTALRLKRISSWSLLTSLCLSHVPAWIG